MRQDQGRARKLVRPPEEENKLSLSMSPKLAWAPKSNENQKEREQESGTKLIGDPFWLSEEKLVQRPLG